MQREEYSPYKIIHHHDTICRLKNRENVSPIHVQIVPTNTCNHNCIGCAYRMEDYASNQNFKNKDVLPSEKLLEIINDCHEMGVKAIQLTGGGEPTVHPSIKQIMNKILSHKIDLALVTNGSKLDDETCSILSNAAWVRVSIDAATKETHSCLRKVPQKEYTKLMSNISNLVSKKRKNIIGIGFVVQKENYKEILVAAKLAKSLGVDNFRISALFTPYGYSYFDDFIKEAKDICKECEHLSDDSFTVFNLFGDRIKDCFEGVQDYDFCPIKEIQAYVGADCNVYTCCTLAYNNAGLVGSIKHQSFKDLWFSTEKISRFFSHNPSIHCRLPCLYKSKNQFINYCLKNNPNHVNFV